MSSVFKKAIWSGIVMALTAILSMQIDKRKRRLDEEARDRERAKHLAASKAEYDLWINSLKKAKELGFDCTSNTAAAVPSMGHAAGC